LVSKRANIKHIEINVSNFDRSKAFYHDFLSWLGYKQIVGGRDFAGWGNGEAEIFVTYLERYKDSGFHRGHVGLNHIAIKVLYGGPKEYPEYRKGYYAVYFEDPDRIKLEFVH
jgi:catechol 2,3-dioxygenase-like lactoylglutathione lyase family enzyme